ncbi:hypothetical protein AB0D13_01095 [Streptomyces sp. NPDC048430]|uniref:hypothetical protein n=1 Tax=unclassified Streptomyces TaxID=2593676 RepID=UPI00341F9C7E
MQKIRKVALVALAVGGLASAGSGLAFADGPGGDGGDSGATATGGVLGSVFQQNTAQTHRQNNNCSHPNTVSSFPTALTGSRGEARCVTGDASFNRHSLVKGGGADATGGGASGFQQNTAQEGRQNNTCANPNDTTVTLAGGRAEARCATVDRSANVGTLVKGGGADATGGNALGHSAQQNTAQEGRQNNACANPNATSVTLTGGRAEDGCASEDGSLNMGTVVKGGGADATGGNSPVSNMFQQNTAQEGRQNNACSNPNDIGIEVTGGRTEHRCTDRDGSVNKDTVVKGGGADATGGNSLGFAAVQQNTAQEGRQNNACDNPNLAGIGLTGARAQGHCANEDGSLNKGSVVKGGGADASGGTSTASGVLQQNTAQEGRQNNACDNPNDVDITLTGGRAESRCATVDRSVNVGTAESSGGAEATGGNGVADLFQQNTAQDGRQNNACGNPNGLTLTATGSRTRTECVAVDESKNIDSVYR